MSIGDGGSSARRWVGGHRNWVLALLTAAIAAFVVVWAWPMMGPSTVSTADEGELGHLVNRPNDRLEANAVGRSELGLASMTATLERGQIELSGRLPDPAVAKRVREVAGIVYGTSIVDDLTVDESVPAPGWAPVAGDVVASLPLISTGQIRLEGEVVTLRGTAGSDEKKLQFVGAVERILGPGVEVVDEVDVVEQVQPVLLIEKTGPDAIQLEGLLPSAAVATRIQDVLAETYPGHSFEGDFSFDGGVEETFTLHSLPRLAGMLVKFAVWEVSYVEGRFESSSAGATSFDFDSVELPMDTPVLDSFAMSLTGVPDLHLTVIGHTDSAGPASYNQGLSERRAATVVDYLVTQHGIEPSRITAVGRGEEEPIAANDTPDGRMKNRRVDFSIEISTG